jgi:queuine tRNA-ribosyltransferase
MQLPDFTITLDTPLGRLGKLKTAHGIIDTPAFIFCATKGAIKALTPWELESLGVQVILSNTYHLAVHPGGTSIEYLGGAHGLSGWAGPMLTDSGGFQVFCLGGHGSVSDEIKGRGSRSPATVQKITEAGVLFQSYRTGAKLLLSPEHSIELQIKIGADLLVNFDECTPCHISYSATKDALARTNRWQERGLQYFKQHHKSHQCIYGVVQGGVHEDLRINSMEFCNKHNFFGYAIGGSLGQNLDDMHRILRVFAQHKIASRPVHLLGMGGYVREIFEALRYGIDTFDCVHPTRIARHGIALRPAGNLNLRRNNTNLGPIDPECVCKTCKYYSQAAIHTLLRAKEMTAIIAITHHNVATMVRLMQEIRSGLASGNLEDTQRRWCK